MMAWGPVDHYCKCGAVFADRRERDNHQDECYQCDWCGEGFDSEDECDRHEERCEVRKC